MTWKESWNFCAKVVLTLVIIFIAVYHISLRTEMRSIQARIYELELSGRHIVQANSKYLQVYTTDKDLIIVEEEEGS